MLKSSTRLLLPVTCAAQPSTFLQAAAGWRSVSAATVLGGAPPVQAGSGSGSDAPGHAGPMPPSWPRMPDGGAGPTLDLPALCSTPRKRVGIAILHTAWLSALLLTCPGSAVARSLMFHLGLVVPPCSQLTHHRRATKRRFYHVQRQSVIARCRCAALWACGPLGAGMLCARRQCGMPATFLAPAPSYAPRHALALGPHTAAQSRPCVLSPCRFCGATGHQHTFFAGGDTCTGQCLPPPGKTYPAEYQPPC